MCNFTKLFRITLCTLLVAASWGGISSNTVGGTHAAPGNYYKEFKENVEALHEESGKKLGAIATAILNDIQTEFDKALRTMEEHAQIIRAGMRCPKTTVYATWATPTVPTTTQVPRYGEAGWSQYNDELDRRRGCYRVRGLCTLRDRLSPIAYESEDDSLRERDGLDYIY